MSQAKPSSNRGGVIIAVIVIVLLLLILIALLRNFNPEADSSSGAGDPSTPATGVVVFQSYYVDPERVNAGNCATVSWVVENADNIQLLRDGSVVVNNGKASDSYRDCPNDPAVYKYRLEASNSENANWIELQLIVDE